MLLTEEGKQLLDRAFEIERTLQLIKMDFDEPPLADNNLRFVASLTIATRVMPSMLTEFVHTYPNVCIE